MTNNDGVVTLGAVGCWHSTILCGVVMQAMRVFLLLLVIAVVARYSSYAQEDVLRPNGRERTTPDVINTAAEYGDAGPGPAGIPGPVIRVGVEAGMNYSMASRTVDGIVETSPLVITRTGSGVSPLYGIFAEFELSPSVALGLRMMMDPKRVSSSRDGILQDCVVLDEYGVPQQVSVSRMRGEFKQSQTFITLAPNVRVSITDRLFAHVGPTVQIPVDHIQGTVTYVIDEADPCVFNFGQPDASKTQTIDAESSDHPSMRLGLDAALGYRLPLSENIDLVPRLGFQLMFTPFDNPTSGEDASRELTDPPARAYTASGASLNALQASVSLWFRL